MSKRPRHLWFGDWQRQDDEPGVSRAGSAADDADTVLIAPVEEPDPSWRARRRRNIQRGAAGVAAVVLLFALGYAISSGGDGGKQTAAQRQPPPAQAQTPQAQPQPQQQLPQVPQGGAAGGFGGPDLTGAGAQKAAEAAVAKYPGDVERVTAAPGGAYVVHVIQADGNEVHVLVDQHGKVQGSDANSGPQGFGAPGTSQ